MDEKYRKNISNRGVCPKWTFWCAQINISSPKKKQCIIFIIKGLLRFFKKNLQYSYVLTSYIENITYKSQPLKAENIA